MIIRLKAIILFTVLPLFSIAQLQFITGVPNGSYQTMAEDLKVYYPNLVLSPSAGSLENFQQLTSKTKKTQLAILQEDVLVDQQFKDMEMGEDNLTGIRLLVSLGLEEIHILVAESSRFKSVKDLKGKRVNVGLPNSGTWVSAQLIAKTLEITWRESNFGLDSAVALLNAKKLDAIFFVGAAPVKQINLLGDSIPMKFLAIDDPKFDEIYYKSTFKAADYPFITSDVPTYAVRSLLVANTNKIDKKQLPELDNFLMAIRDNFSNLQSNGHPKWKEASFNTSQFIWPPYENADEIFFPKAPLAPEIILLSGVEHGSYQEFAEDIRKISSHVKATENSKGAVDNFRQLFLRDKYFVSFIQQDVLIEQKLDDQVYETNYSQNLRVLMPMANEDIHLVTLKSNNLKTIKDLKNKKVGVGTVNQGTQITAKLVKDFTGGQWNEIEIDLENGLKALAEKNIDALFFVGSAPVLALKEIINGEDIELIPITGKKMNKAYKPSVIKANSYPWLKTDVETFAVTSVLVTNISNETPEQKANIEGMLKDIYQNIAKLKLQGHTKWSEVNFDFSDVKWEIYPSATEILKK